MTEATHSAEAPRGADDERALRDRLERLQLQLRDTRQRRATVEAESQSQTQTLQQALDGAAARRTRATQALRRAEDERTALGQRMTQHRASLQRKREDEATRALGKKRRETVVAEPSEATPFSPVERYLLIALVAMGVLAVILFNVLARR